MIQSHKRSPVLHTCIKKRGNVRMDQALEDRQIALKEENAVLIRRRSEEEKSDLPLGGHVIAQIPVDHRSLFQQTENMIVAHLLSCPISHQRTFLCACCVCRLCCWKRKHADNNELTMTFIQV